jgi:hypothetical protein
MKPIDQMNLAELANKLCDLHEGDTVGLLRIADRMDKIHDLTRWIPVSERFPYEADAKGAEAIVWSNDGKYWKRIEKPEGKP